MFWAGVKSRLFVDPLDEQIGLFSPPCLQSLNVALRFQGALWDVVVVSRQIQRQGGLQLQSCSESSLLDQVLIRSLNCSTMPFVCGWHRGHRRCWMFSSTQVTSKAWRPARLFVSITDCLAEAGYTRVIITCAPDNLSSVQGIRNAGFCRVKTLRSVYPAFALDRHSDNCDK